MLVSPRDSLHSNADGFSQVMSLPQFRIGVLFVVGVVCFRTGNVAAEVPRNADQLIVAVAPDWESHRVKLQCFERDGRKWKPVFAAPVPALVGRSGLAWGIGVHPPMRGSGETEKRERDGRAPAGIFALGKVYGYAAQLPEGADYLYRKVTEWDAWVDDPENPLYNKHVVVNPRDVPPWFEKQKMRHGDFAYRWLLEIRHNADRPVPGAGSAIFFHIRRGEDRATAGCTTMEQSNLEFIIRWLRADKNPHYVLLPREEYDRRQKEWKLPEFE